MKDMMGIELEVGQQGNIRNTTGRLFILSKRVERERMVFTEQIKVLTERNVF